MSNIATIKVNDKREAIKYAYAFMKNKKLNLKECAFINPAANNFDPKYIMPRDFFSAQYKNSVPTWEEFKSNPIHISALGFNCVACVDKQDQKRVNCTYDGSNIVFNCFGNYEEESKKAFTDIKELVLTLN